MQYLTPKDVQGILKISRNNVYALFKSEDFPAVKIGKQFRVSEEALEKYLNERKVGAEPNE